MPHKSDTMPPILAEKAHIATQNVQKLDKNATNVSKMVSDETIDTSFANDLLASIYTNTQKVFKLLTRRIGNF